jgi:hypothetical protein
VREIEREGGGERDRERETLTAVLKRKSLNLWSV